MRSDNAVINSKWLILSLQTIQAYQDTTLGSIAFKLRLLELVVIACHNIAVYLYQLDDGAHKHAEWEQWHAEKLKALANEEREESRVHRFYHGPPTPFFFSGYGYYNKYPNGLADVVGYWLEYEIFGGVVLFDRGESEEEVSEIMSRQDFAPPDGVCGLICFTVQRHVHTRPGGQFYSRTTDRKAV